MTLLTWAMLFVASVILLLLIVILVAQIKSSRHIESLKRRVELEKKAEKAEAIKPRIMKGAQPSQRPGVIPAQKAESAAAAPEAETVPEPIAPETVPSGPEELAVEIPEAPVVEAAAAPEMPLPVEEAVVPEVPTPVEEAEVPTEVPLPEPVEAVEEAPELEAPVAEEAPAEAAFEPKPYPGYDNARAVEQLGLSQEEADMFVSELVTQIGEELPNLDAAIADHDVEKIERVSHMLKGSATSLGTGGVADVLVDFNTYCKSGDDPQVIREHMENLRYYFGKLQEQFPA